MNVLEKLKKSLEEQKASYEKTINKLVKENELERAEFLQAKAESHLGALAEGIFYIERMELVNRSEESTLPPLVVEDINIHPIRKMELTQGKEAARAESIFITETKWPELYQPWNPELEPKKITQ